MCSGVFSEGDGSSGASLFVRDPLFCLLWWWGRWYLLNGIPPVCFSDGCPLPIGQPPHPLDLQEQTHQSSVVTFEGVFSVLGYLMVPRYSSAVLISAAQPARGHRGPVKSAFIVCSWFFDRC